MTVASLNSERLRISQGAPVFITTAAAMLLFFVSLWLVPLDYPDSANKIVAEATERYQFVSSRDQRTAHFATALFTSLLCGVGFALTHFRIAEFAGRLRLPRVGVPVRSSPGLQC